MDKQTTGMILTIVSAIALMAETYFAFFNPHAINDQIHNLLAMAGCLGFAIGMLLWLRKGLR